MHFGRSTRAVFLGVLIASCSKDDPPPERANVSPAADPEPAAAPPPAPAKEEPRAAPVGPSAFTMDALQAATTVKSCFLDLVNGAKPDGRPIPRRSTAVLQGWAIDLPGKSVPTTVIVVFESPSGTFSVPATRAGKRPDLTEHFKDPVFVNGGYHATVSLEDVPPGDYRVKLFQALEQGATVCDTERVITVT